MIHCQVLILGAGPGGYAAALRAAQRGLRVCLVEEKEVGGVCLNRGCIPTKTLLQSATLWRRLEHAEEFGVNPERISFSWPEIQRRRRTVTGRLRQGLSSLLVKRGVTVIRGRGSFEDEHFLQVLSGAKKQMVRFDHAIIATGSRPVIPPIPGADLPGVMDSDSALTLEELPRSLAIIGGGVIGLEMAEIYAAFGVSVTIVELLDGILNGWDADVVKAEAAACVRKGIGLHTSSRVYHITRQGAALEVNFEGPDGPAACAADRVLIATGRRPNPQGVDRLPLGDTTRGIPVDESFRTVIPHIFAIGDVTGKTALAHAATHQGIQVADLLAGGTCDGCAPIPSCLYTDPPAAMVGLTQAQATETYGKGIKIGLFPFSASGMALVEGEAEGFLKLIFEPECRQLVGAHLVGPCAYELIGGLSYALANEATLESLLAAVFPHPTLSEAVWEAAAAAAGLPLHAF